MNKYLTLEPTKYTLKKMFEQTDTKEFIFRHGHIAITNYTMGDNREFEKSLSIFDEINWKYHLCGGYYIEELKEFRINRGYDVNLLHKFFPSYKPRVENDAYPYDDVTMDLLVPPKSDFQRVALTFMASKGQYKSNSKFTQQIIDADTGDGKAQPNDTLIPTPKGMKRLDSLKIGDKVFNQYGEPVKILAIYPQKGLQETYEVTFKDGRTTRCNPEHLWKVITCDGKSKIIPLSEMVDTYKKNITEGVCTNVEYQYAIPFPKPVQYKKQDLLILPYEMGVMSKKNMLKFNDTFIGDKYKYNSIENREQVLMGLLDKNIDINDFRHAKTISYSTISERMKNDIVEIARSIGYLAYVEYNDNGIYNIIITHPSNNTLTIIDIKKVEPTKQRCIYIDDPSHIYMTENFIPTHNTYCGIATSCYLSAKTIIFVPFSKLLDQWKEAYLNFTSLKEDDILIVKGSKICKKVINGDYKNIKIFIVMVDTIFSFVKHYGNLECIEFLRATGAYIKIVDEIHRDMKTISMLEALSNFQMNYYMSASPGRSDKKENWIFKSLFRNVPKFGSKFKLEEEKHLNIIIKKYNFTPDSKQMKKMINRKGWLNVKCYETEMFNSPDYQKAGFNEALVMMLNWSKNLLKPDNKIMILVNTIDGTAYIQDIAEKIFPGETAVYYGTMKPESKKQKALESRIICATVGSLGTGADIKNIQFVYNCTTYSNWIDATQISGRARKLSDGTQVVYCELVNFAFRKTVAQYEKRKPFLVKRAKTGRLMIVD